MNFYDSIFLQAALDPLRPALCYPGGLATYGVLARSANHVAAHLVAMGVAPGQICTIRIQDPLLHLLVVLGLGRIGAASLSLGDQKPLDDFGLDVAACFVDARRADDEGAHIHVVSDAFYAAPTPAQASPYASTIKGWRGTGATLVAVCMSSGTTGRPKAVGLTHDILEARTLAPLMGGAGKRNLSTMGLDTFGGYWNAISTLRQGGMVCFAPQGPLVLEMASFFSVTDLLTSPAQMLALLAEQKACAAALPELRSIVVGGAPLPGAAQIEAERLFGARITIGYGSTEAGAVSLAVSTIHDPGANTCGYPMPWLDVEIVDAADLPVPQGEEGAIRVRGPGVVQGYLRPVPEDSAMFRGDWFYPGDLGRLDGDNLLHVTGRLGLRINRGGVKIAPETIEEVLASHPGVRDCAAVGLKTVDGDMRIVVGVVRAQDGVTEQALRTYCQSRIPDRTPDDFFFMEDLPRTSLGKIARTEIHDMLKKAYQA